jgi:hypothetical protein
MDLSLHISAALADSRALGFRFECNSYDFMRTTDALGIFRGLIDL